MSSVTVRYLEFRRKNGKAPVKYPLKVGPNVIGTSLAYDVRIKSKNQVSEPVTCVLDVRGDGIAILENQCSHPITYNGKTMEKIQILKNKDQFEVVGQHFMYVNPIAAFKEITDSVKTKKRQSALPTFKIEAGSRIPAPAKSSSARCSLSARKPKNQQNQIRRSCASALPNRNRSIIFDWDSTKSPNLIAGRSSTKKSADLDVLVHKSLFLKNKGDISFSNSIVVDRKSLVFNMNSSISSPRGRKRGRESTDPPRMTKKGDTMKS